MRAADCGVQRMRDNQRVPTIRRTFDVRELLYFHSCFAPAYTFPFPLIGTKTSISLRYMSRFHSFSIFLTRHFDSLRADAGASTDVLISIANTAASRTHSRRRQGKKKDTPPWVEPECKNITAPWEITRVEIPGRTQTVLNARIMKMPIRSPDVLDTRLYCIRRKTQLSLSDSGVFVNIKRNQRAIFALRNLWAVVYSKLHACLEYRSFFIKVTVKFACD